MKRSTRLLLFGLAAALTGLGSGAQALAKPLNPWEVCDALVVQAELALKLPRHLLRAIAKAESGRWNNERRAIIAWPWTVMAEGRGRYLPTKEAAIAEVEALLARGVRNIDVGCMQVNLQYHGKAFDNLSDALDPAQNVAYAALFLTDLRRQARSWTRAVGYYHSRTPMLGSRYRNKVYRIWRQEKREAYQLRRAELRARRQARIEAAALPVPAPAEGAISPGALFSTSY